MIEESVSIILVNWNGKDDTVECIDSIYKNTNHKNYEIILVDNASSDDSVKILKRKFPKVKIIENKENLGFSKANNVGANKSKSKYLVFLNNDTIVEKNWLSRLLKDIKDKEVGIVMPKIIYSGSDKINTTGGNMSIFGMAFVIGKGEKKMVLNKKEDRFWASGCCTLMEKNLFEKVSGFDERFFLYSEDLDLSWKVLNEGKKIIYEPASEIYHKEGTSTKKLSKNYSRPPIYYYYQNRNIFFSIIENSKFPILLFLVLSRAILNIFQSIAFLLTGKPKRFYLVLKGTLEGIFKAKRSKKNRQRVKYVGLLYSIKKIIKMLGEHIK